MAEIFYTTLQFGCWRSFTGAHLQIDEDIKDRNTNESLQISMTSSSLGTICTAKNLFWAYQLSYQIKGFRPGPRAFYIYLSPFSTFRCIFFIFTSQRNRWSYVNMLFANMFLPSPLWPLYRPCLIHRVTARWIDHRRRSLYRSRDGRAQTAVFIMRTKTCLIIVLHLATRLSHCFYIGDGK